MMTEEQRKQYLARFLAATKQWSGETIPAFASEEARQRHEQQVKDDIDSGQCTF